MGDAAGYLLENLEVKTVLFQERVIALNLPMTVDLRVEDTAPAIKGATAQAQLKPATVETGITVLVPSYIESGERIRVDTRDGRFVERGRGSYMCAITASPNSLHFTSLAPSIRRAKS